MITIHGELYSSKNSKRIVKFGEGNAIISSKAYLDSIRPIELQLSSLRWKFKEKTKNLTKPLFVGFYLYRKTHRKFDFINIIQGISDLMTKCGWIPDDNVSEYVPIFLGWEVDKNDPRTEIYLSHPIDYMMFCEKCKKK